MAGTDIIVVVIAIDSFGDGWASWGIRVVLEGRGCRQKAWLTYGIHQNRQVDAEYEKQAVTL